MNPKTIYRWALANFIITAVVGFAMRLYPLGLLAGFHYKNWLHTHSHLAFLGWIYPAMIALILERRRQPVGSTVAYLFYTMQVLVLAMLITFPQYGYGWPSIVVLSLHMVATIWLIFYLMRKPWPEFRAASIYIRAGAWMLVISALGALALGPISAMGFKYSPYYYSAIYFYLHFQYNGWFTLAIAGILIPHVFPDPMSSGQHRAIRYGLWCLLAGIIGTYALSVIGYDVPGWVSAVGGLGALVQAVGFGVLGGAAIRVFRRRYPAGSATVRMLFAIAVAGLVMKLVLQLLSAWPAISEFAYRSRDLIIAYLHEYLIGTVTLTLLALAIAAGWIATKRYLVRLGIWIFVAGFLVTELGLLLRGVWPVANPVHIQYALAAGAAGMTGALLCIVWGTFDGEK